MALWSSLIHQVIQQLRSGRKRSAFSSSFRSWSWRTWWHRRFRSPRRSHGKSHTPTSGWKSVTSNWWWMKWLIKMSNIWNMANNSNNQQLIINQQYWTAWLLRISLTHIQPGSLHWVLDCWQQSRLSPTSSMLSLTTWTRQNAESNGCFQLFRVFSFHPGRQSGLYYSNGGWLVVITMVKNRE